MEPVPVRRNGTHVRVQDFADVCGFGGGNLVTAAARRAQMSDGGIQSRHQRSRAANQRSSRKQGTSYIVLT